MILKGETSPQGEQLHSNQPPPASVNVSMVTHVSMEGHGPVPVWEFKERFGISYEDRQDALKQRSERLTHCIIGGVALTLEEFEEKHPLIQLGQE